MDERTALLWLAQRLGPCNGKADLLLARFGSAAAVYDAPVAALKELSALRDKERSRLGDRSLDGVKTLLSWCEKNGVTVLTPADAGYPERLRQVAPTALCLFIKGELPAVDEEIAVAVIGTRQMTEYGRAAAQTIARDLAAGGALVVAGLARGIDSAAHIGALKGGGKTVAVLGCGIDVCYPPENEELAALIVKNGCLVTEYPPGTRPLRGNFPERNRLISGLTLGTLVVESPQKSGALITASLAAEQGRDVFAVPGNIDSPMSTGTNELIKVGAKPVTSASDILLEYVSLFPEKIRSPEPRPRKDAPPPIPVRERPVPAPKPAEPLPSAAEDVEELYLSGDEETVLSAVRGGVATADDLAEQTGLDLRRISAALTLLEIKGYVRRLPGGRFSQ